MIIDYDKPERYKLIHDEILIKFLENNINNKYKNINQDHFKENAIVINSTKGIYTLEGNLIPNSVKKNDVIRVHRRQCVQIDKDHYTIRNEYIV